MEREEISERVISDHVVYSLAAGAIPVPFFDLAAVMAIQVDLVRALARIYEVEFDPATGKALIASLVGASAMKVGASIAKAVPGVGSVGGAVTQVSLSGASTYAIGQLFRSHFVRQGSLSDLDPESMRPVYEKLLDRGRSFVRGLRSDESPLEKTTELLERLARLRTEQVIDDDEFRRLKQQALATS